MSALFVLRPADPANNLSTRYRVVEPREGKQQHCAACNGELGPPDWLAPHKVELLASGAILTDLVFGPRADLVISEEFAELWRKWGLTGLEGFEPVTVVDVKAVNTFTGDPRPYLHVRVAQSPAKLDDKESEVERTGGMACKACGLGGVLKHLRRVALKPAPVPVEDLFVAQGLPFAVLASEKFAEAIGKARVSGHQLVAADQIRAL